MTLPDFRYHPDPLASGSVEASEVSCVVCGEKRGYIYVGPVYAEEDLNGALCPWCIADGSASEQFDASFVDSEAFPVETPETAIETISRRTPGYSAWQGEEWPLCCSDSTAFMAPAGIAEVRSRFRQFESPLLNHIIYAMKISGGAATRMLESLRRDAGPTAYLFRCLKCEQPHVHIDAP